MRAISYLQQGHTRTDACRSAAKDFGRPPITWATIRRFCQQSPELAEMLEEAETESYDVLADTLVQIDTDGKYGSADPAMANVISKNIQFLLSRRRPKDYGDRLDVNVSVTADKVIVDALKAAQLRGPAPAQIIDLTAVRKDRV